MATGFLKCGRCGSRMEPATYGFDCPKCDLGISTPGTIGQQFKDIVDQNFTPEDKARAIGEATGEHLFNKIDDVLGGYKSAVARDAAERLSNISLNLPSMMRTDENGLHVSYTGPKGWTHKWWGGEYIEHSHPDTSAGKDNPVDVTNVMDHRTGKLPDLDSDEFLRLCHDFENTTDPKDY